MEKNLTITNHQITDQTIKDYLFGSNTKLNEQQQIMFCEMAKAYQLNPFKREIYAVSYGNNFNLIVGYEVYLKRAELSGKLNGWESSVHGSLSNKNDMYAEVIIFRKDWEHPLKHKVYFAEFGKNTKPWQEMPRFMLEKVAIAQAFRRAFPEDLAGMPYTSEEIINYDEVKNNKELAENNNSLSKEDILSKAIQACAEGWFDLWKKGLSQEEKDFIKLDPNLVDQLKKIEKESC